jgi:ABC-type uncharacterized transport system substrate-binding protein
MVELLKEATPRIARVGFLHGERGAGATYLRDLETATRALGLTLQDLRVREVNEIEGTLGAMSKEQGGSLIVPGDLLLMRHASQITQLATKYNLPGIYGTRVFMDAGGLSSTVPAWLISGGGPRPTSTRSSRVPNPPIFPSSNPPSSSWSST